ncbi:MAG: NADH-quinone oxidoreductase subunit C [Candidatus Nanopelagicales bacterium]
MQRVDASAWLSAVQAEMANGFTEFVTLIGIDNGGLQVWLRLADHDGNQAVLATNAEAGIDSLVTMLPRCAWYEREAAEMFGIRFHGHDTAPLLLSAAAALPPMRKDSLLAARQVAWPGEKEPGGVIAHRRHRPPGVSA